MSQTVAIIGVGHFAGYLITGFKNAGMQVNLRLFSRTRERAQFAIKDYANAEIYDNPQEAVTGASVVIVATRPKDVATALAGISFDKEQVVVSVAAGVSVAQLQSLIGVATAIRALPVACAAINKSPVLMMPENPAARAVLQQFGQVYILPSEDQFEAGTALVGAFYAMMFPLMEHLASWTARQGLDEDTARSLVVSTINGASAMAEHDRDVSFEKIWTSLAVPGGISERGMQVVNEADGLAIWSASLDAVVCKLKHKQ